MASTLDFIELALYGAYATFFRDIGKTIFSSVPDTRTPPKQAPLAKFSSGRVFQKSSGGEFTFDLGWETPNPQQARQILKLVELIQADPSKTLYLKLAGLDQNLRPSSLPEPTKDPNIYSTAFAFTQPITPRVDVRPDPQSTFSVKTDSAQGAKIFKNTVVVGKPSTFFFSPQTTMRYGYKETSGVDVGYSVTEGISNTSSSGGSATTSAGVNISGSFLGLEVGAELSKSWTQEWSNSQTLDFSKTVSKQISKTIETDTGIDLAGLQPNSKGEYYYNGVKLVPDERYTFTATENIVRVEAPIKGEFVISSKDLITAIATKPGVGNSLFPISGPGTSPGYILPGQTGKDYLPSVRKPLTELIYNGAKLLNYDAVYSGDLSSRNWTTRSNPDELLMEVSSRATFAGADETGVTISVKPVVTPRTGQPMLQALQVLATDSSPSTQSSYSDWPIDIFLNDYNVPDSRPGVAFFLSELGTASSQRYRILGTTEGGDYVVVDGHPAILSDFKDSLIQVESGYNFFLDSLSSVGNRYILNGGVNNVYLGGSNGYVDSNGGNSLVAINSEGRVDVNCAVGRQILKLANPFSQIYVSNWNYKDDTLMFDEAIDIRDVRIIFDEGMSDFQVSVGGNLVAILDVDPQSDPTPAYDSLTGRYAGTAVQPFDYSSQDKFLSTLYAAAFNRLPDSGGEAYWQSFIRDGGAKDSVVAYLFSGEEYSSARTENAAFLTGLYNDILGRSPDSSGFQYWIGRLEGGVDRFGVVQAFVASNEFNAFFS